MPWWQYFLPWPPGLAAKNSFSKRITQWLTSHWSSSRTRVRHHYSASNTMASMTGTTTSLRSWKKMALASKDTRSPRKMATFWVLTELHPLVRRSMTILRLQWCSCNMELKTLQISGSSTHQTSPSPSFCPGLGMMFGWAIPVATWDQEIMSNCHPNNRNTGSLTLRKWASMIFLHL